jgi:tripartite-type tricarboxylate transporter receptor subunit TctC
MHRNRRWRTVFWACALLVLSPAADAQSYPAKVVRVVVPFAPGAGVDTLVRVFTPHLSEMFKQQFIVDNRGGATGSIASEMVARAAPDGYTLLAVSAALASNAAMDRNLSFDLVRDFAPVALLASQSYALAVHPSVPVHGVPELIAFAKANPGKLTYASTGTGSAPHLTAEMFKMMAGVDILHVPYKGSGTAIPDLIGGQVSMMFSASVIAPAKAGRLRLLAMTSASRSPAAPEVPTIAETFPGFESGTWFGFIAPAKTPREIVMRLNKAVATIAGRPDVQATMKALAAEPMGGTPEEVGVVIRKEIEKWAKVVKATGANLQ